MSSVIDTIMLSAMRDALETLLPDSCNILTLTQTPDGMGGQTESWGTTYGTITCRLDVRHDRQLAVNSAGAGFTTYQEYFLTLPYDQTITYENRVEVGSHTFTVVNVNVEQSWIVVKRVQLEVLHGDV